ncbi:hypothetical protein [Streptomyces sp. CdTB01]|uniref:hypothetical protein n=1 Tax=Streptomyces sp. CdTB01 TaxID=1725411 RepID=UPI000A5C34EA|nr:hypothetical protein [Streptomyces sp. CdTB01]
MDMESAPVTGRSAVDLFARDLAMCLSVHRDRGPALVWSDGAETFVAEPSMAGLPQTALTAEQPGSAPVVPSSPARAGELAEELGRLLGCEARSTLLLLPVGRERPDNKAATDLVLLPVEGGCDCRVDLEAATDRARGQDATLNLRLRVGEALYVPCGLTYTLGGVHAPCILQVISLHDSSW